MLLVLIYIISLLFENKVVEELYHIKAIIVGMTPALAGNADW